MKRGFKTYALVILLVFAMIFIFVKGLESFVKNKDLKEAISTVNLYKEAKTFQEAQNYIAYGTSGIGFITRKREGDCPCSITFNERTFDWKPNVVLSLSESKAENGKIILIYNSVQNENNVYQFVMTKTAGWKQDNSKTIGMVEDKEEKWRIQEIHEIAAN
ncbi:hypothetical protein AM500_13400 [Bacillus sp. FJAT-18017]|uniref:hypothetical protein n=1 Tax=Bacillus sp. FJAT-18017 TaxID=1705566 RepID=UPI0006ADF8FD|nr:hypothetical protein [Bacillus sp. FJAT-18017]ALC90668.1 hypothetical protein AM500_13400 [Bacillus sp. FJAT-18017]